MDVGSFSSNPPEKGLCDRRRFFAYFSGMGLGATLLPELLWSQVEEEAGEPLTSEMIAGAEKLAGLEFTDEEREALAGGLNRQVENYQALRAIPLPNNVPPALQFNPILPGMTFDQTPKASQLSAEPLPEWPAVLEEAAFWPITRLSRAIQARLISSQELTHMYLDRLKRYDPLLKCVITLTEDLAIEQARRADREIAAGHYRGPLHGICWGAKDLLAVRGYKTTWGAMPYKDQVINEDATVVARLEEAGAVLVAKLTLGALAMGDVWFGGQTRSPWDPQRGSSGSSAGPAAAVAAGLVGFAIGTETNGSIASPATRCGVTGLRPTFGCVSRHGAMALSWSMDKIGPLCRSVEDTAIVLGAICGSDGKDPTAIDLPFNWNASLNIKDLRIGYAKNAFNNQGHNEKALDALRALGVDPIAIDLPDLPEEAMYLILSVEAAAAFDELTLSNRDDLLVSQHDGAWPNAFRRARLVPAVEYLQANRVRTLLMQQLARRFQNIDAYLTPTFHHLLMTNLTGHPMITLPSGLDDGGQPTSIAFIGNLYGEDKLLAIAKAYQDATGHHLKHPTLPAPPKD